MRAVWSGTISFGLVTLPVQLVPATEERRVALREIHTADGSPVRHRRWCQVEDRPIPSDEVGRGWRTDDGHLVPLSDAELEQLPLPTKRVITVLGFVAADRLDPISYSRAYYATPHGAPARRPYALLVEALDRAGRVGVGRLAIRSRERLAAIRPAAGVLVVHTLLWPDEVRAPVGLALEPPALSERELDLARVLVEQLTDAVDLAEQHDEYRHALEQLIAAKIQGAEIVQPPEPPPPADLLAALEESVRRMRGE